MTGPSFVIDNSVVMAICFNDERTEYAVDVLRALSTEQAVAPAVWPLEVGNALLVAERRKRIPLAAFQQMRTLVQQLPIHVEQEQPSRMLADILTIARSLQLSTYDASYLDLAMRKGLPIATQDKGLLKAAKKTGVPLFNPKQHQP